jgi:hypothetical protein
VELELTAFVALKFPLASNVLVATGIQLANGAAKLVEVST